MALLSSLPSSAGETNESEPMKLLSLAVAQLDELINRLSHLLHITHHSFPPAKENQPAFLSAPILVALPKEDKE